MRRTGVVAAYLGLMLTTTAMSQPSGGHRGRGNSWNSGNYWSRGHQVNSGNFSVAKGSPNSNNVFSGSNFANGSQCINERRSIVKWRC